MEKKLVEVILGVSKMNHYDSQGKRLRTGFTTGSCAAAAAKAGAIMLLTGEIPRKSTIRTPQGAELTLPVLHARFQGSQASCAVKKDSGDDPDITNGLLIYAVVSKTEGNQIIIEGGAGIGRVTKPGLACKIGEAAINPVPRKMIEEETKKVCRENQYQGGLLVTISAPTAEKIAAKTFNPRLGIEGGISILGTSGLVEPMSEKAWTDTIYLEMKQQFALGKRNLLLCPGNYGQDFIQGNLCIDVHKALKCSNFIGEALDYALELGFESVLLIGHAGKLVKLGAGIMNTHSKYADARMEVLAVHAALCGAPAEVIRRIMNCHTTEEAALILRQENLSQGVFAGIMDKIDFYVQNRTHRKLKIGVVLFSNEWGILGQTRSAQELIELHQQADAF